MQSLLSLLTRPALVWFLAPFVITAGLLLGILSAASEDAASMLPVATPAGTPPAAATAAPTARPKFTPVPQSLTGRIVQFAPREQSIIVLTRANKYVTVILHPATIARLNGERVRLRDIRIGDEVVVLGKRNAFNNVDATLITIKTRAPAPAH